MSALAEVFKHTLLITGFVFVMMLVIEYLNVLTRGAWDRKLKTNALGQTIVGSVLGAVPGCLGSFAAVSLYTHRVLTFGALVATMIATSGDEAFVMLALFPEKALLLFAILICTAIVTGLITDKLSGSRLSRVREHMDEHPPVHKDEARCVCFSSRELFDQWKSCTAHRGILSFVLLLFVLGVASGEIGHAHLGETGADIEHRVETEGAAVHEDDHHEGLPWNWVRVTMLLIGLAGLLIVSTVPDHFLESHLWDHLARVHVWRIFLWTFGTLLVLHVVVDRLPLENGWLRGSHLSVLLVACLVGLIPQSGPHLIFITLYAGGHIPFSILVAGSIVQDGHGMLPMLAHSRSGFVSVKILKFAIGLMFGLIGYFTGW